MRQETRCPSEAVTCNPRGRVARGGVRGPCLWATCTARTDCVFCVTSRIERGISLFRASSEARFEPPEPAHSGTLFLYARGAHGTLQSPLPRHAKSDRWSWDLQAVVLRVMSIRSHAAMMPNPPGVHLGTRRSPPPDRRYMGVMGLGREELMTRADDEVKARRGSPGATPNHCFSRQEQSESGLGAPAGPKSPAGPHRYHAMAVAEAQASLLVQLVFFPHPPFHLAGRVGRGCAWLVSAEPPVCQRRCVARVHEWHDDERVRGKRRAGQRWPRRWLFVALLHNHGKRLGTSEVGS